MPVGQDSLEGCVTSVLQQREEFGARPGVVLENTEQTRRFHYRVLFFNASHHHAKVLRFHHHCHARGFQAVHECLGNLRGKILLDL